MIFQWSADTPASSSSLKFGVGFCALLPPAEFILAPLSPKSPIPQIAKRLQSSYISCHRDTEIISKKVAAEQRMTVAHSGSYGKIRPQLASSTRSARKARVIPRRFKYYGELIFDQSFAPSGARKICTGSLPTVATVGCYRTLLPQLHVGEVLKMLRPCCGFVADLLRIKSLMLNAVADVADFQTSYAKTDRLTALFPLWHYSCRFS